MTAFTIAISSVLEIVIQQNCFGMERSYNFRYVLRNSGFRIPTWGNHLLQACKEHAPFEKNSRPTELVDNSFHSENHYHLNLLKVQTLPMFLWKNF